MAEERRAALAERTGRLLAVAPVPCGWHDLERALVHTRRLINAYELHFARLAAALHEQRPEGQDLADTVSTLEDSCRITRHAATAAIEIGSRSEALAAPVAAMREGRTGFAHLTWIADFAVRLEHAGVKLGERDGARMLRAAERYPVQKFRRWCDDFIHQVDRRRFLEDERDAAELRRLRVRHYADGSMDLRGWFDPEGTAVIRTALEPLVQRIDESDHRCVAQRRADAFLEICTRVLDSATLPLRGGVRPHLQVTTTFETLLGEPGSPAAQLETGAQLSAEAVARIACDSTVARVVLDSRSQVIDVGRAQRVVPPATRRALLARDRGCSWPGCDRRASWTQAHHLLHWARGGATTLDNLVLLCRRHHWMVHEGGWSIVRTETGRILTLYPLGGHYPTGPDPAALAV